MKAFFFTSTVLLFIFFSLATTAQNTQPSFCGTGELLNKLHAHDAATQNLRKQYHQKIYSPSGSRSHWSTTTAHFKIHFSDSGPDSVSQVDVDANTLPDYVDDVAIAAEAAYAFYSTHHYTMPPLAGQTEYQIWIDTIHSGNTLAYTAPDSLVHNNPNSADIEVRASSSYIVIRNDLTSANLLNYVRTIICHEYFHAVAFGYNDTLTSFFHESNAAFHQELIYPGLQSNYGFLPSLFNRPDHALYVDAYTNYSAYEPLFEYGAWLWNEYLAEHVDTSFCTKLLLRSIYAQNAKDELDAYRDALGLDYEKALPQTFGNFAVANLLLTNTQAYQPFTYKDGFNMYTYLSTPPRNIERIHTDDTIHYTGTPVHTTSTTDGNSRLMRMSADYIRIESNSNFAVTLTPAAPNTNLMLFLACYNSSTFDWQVRSVGSKPDGSKYMVNVKDHAVGNYYYLVIARINYSPDDTMQLQYSIDINAPGPWMFYDMNPYFRTGANYVDDLIMGSDTSVYVAMGFGALRFTNGRWRNISHYYATSLTEDFQHNIWWLESNGQWGEKYNPSTNISTVYWDSADVRYRFPATILSMATDNSGKILIGGGYYVQKFDGSQNFDSIDYTPPADDATAMKVVPGGDVWIGTNYGVGRSDGTAPFTLIDTLGGLPHNVVTGLGIAPDGTVWAGTAYGGMAYYDNTSHTFVRYDSIWNHFYGVTTYVHDIEFDPHNGKMWVATTVGLFKFLNNHWTVYNPASSPLPTYTIYNLAISPDGCVWMGTDKGVAMYCDTSSVLVSAPSTRREENIFKIFPNPVSDWLMVYIEGNDNSIELQITDLEGKLVRIFKPQVNAMSRLDVSLLSKGIYLCRLMNSDKTVEVRKVVKM